MRQPFRLGRVVDLLLKVGDLILEILDGVPEVVVLRQPELRAKRVDLALQPLYLGGVLRRPVVCGVQIRLRRSAAAAARKRKA